MSSILSVSPMQMLDLWDELHSAMSGNNKFGGDVAEVYLFRLMPHCPLQGSNPESEIVKTRYQDAAANLHALCRLFESRHDVEITFDHGDNIDGLLDKAILNNHRVRLHVSGHRTDD